MHSCTVRIHDNIAIMDIFCCSTIQDTESHIDTAGHIVGGGGREGGRGERRGEEGEEGGEGKVGRRGEGVEGGFTNSPFGGCYTCPVCSVSPA